MDAYAQLALMTKMQRVFEAEGTFLSFPVLSPLVYPPDRLRFADPSQMTPQKLTDLSEFARITNRMPRGVIAPIDEDEHLWDVYGEVLQTAKLAAREAPSAAEQAQYDKAIKLLYELDEDGFRRDGPALTAYKQHRDAHIKAVEEYNNRRSTGELSNDPAVKAQWAQDEPVLRENIDRIVSEWRTAGHKDAVEAAQQDEEAFVVRMPSLQWDEWKTSFVRDIDLATDTNLIEFALTGFSPYDVFDHGFWQRFNLTKDEMSTLAADAPAELSAIFGSEADAAEIESLSFEYRSVALTRPWFRSAIFRSRFWRLGEGGGELSDGGEPPKGRCPSYVSGLVFARNITVTSRPAGAESASEEPAKPSVFRLDASVLERVRGVMRAEVDEAPARPFVATDLLKSRIDLSGVARVSAEPAPARVLERAVSPPATTTRPIASMPARMPALRMGSLAFTEVVPAEVKPVRLTLAEAASTPEPTETPSEEPAATAPSSDVTIVAFICKRLPRSPDPDPALDWS